MDVEGIFGGEFFKLAEEGEGLKDRELRVGSRRD